MSRAQEIASPEEFAAELTRLRAEAAMTVRDVSKVTGIPAATLGGYFSGRHLPPPTQPQVLEDLLHALGIEVAEHHPWREALLRVRRTPGPKKAAPYRGLAAYNVQDADLFFGREALVQELVAEVGELRAQPGPRLLFVVGVSGAGKSSLLRAGVLAGLAGRGVPVTTCVPGVDPLRELAEALDGLADDGVLLVDQAEEVFGWHDEVRTAFVDRLLQLPQVVLLALRADFYSRAVAEPRLLPHLQRHTRLVGPMASEELTRAITEPAVRGGGSVEPALVDLLRRDLAGRRSADGIDPGALPLLAHALLATWQRSKGGRLTVSDYVATGGIEGAIRQTAEDVFQGLDEAGRTAARQLFGQLVSVADDGTPTRRRVDHAQLSGYDEHLESAIHAFVSGRILTAGEHELDITHEALLGAWPRLAGWIEEDRDDLRIHGRVLQAARAWDEHGQEDSALLGGSLLGLAEGLAQRREERGIALPALEQEFIARSQAHQQAALDGRRRRQRRTELLLVAVAVLALVTSAFAVVALSAKGDAGEARDNARSRLYAAQAVRTAERDPAAAAQIALAAYQEAPTVEARSVLLDVTARPRATRLRNPSGPLRAVPSPDGRTLAVVSSDGHVRFWDLRTNEVVAKVPVGEGGELYAAAYSPDGKTFAAGGGNGALAVFDVSDREEPRLLDQQPTPQKTAAQGITFSPDGRELAVATSDPSLLRWPVAGGPTATTTGFGGSVQSVAYAPGGRLVATASSDGRFRLWRGAEEVSSQLIVRETNYVNAVAFSPSGSLLATASKDKTARVWDVSTPARPRLVKELPGGFTSWVNGVAFSPDGRLLAATASGGLTTLWRTSDWSVARDIPAASNNTAVTFTHDGRSVVTSQLSGMAEVHALASPLLTGYGDNIWALSRAGDLVAAGVGTAAPALEFLGALPDGSLRRGSRLTAPAEAGLLTGAAAVSPNGRLAVAGTATGKLVFWRQGKAGWKPAGVVAPSAGIAQGVMFSEDGSALLATFDDGTVALYASGSEGIPRLRHTLDPKSGAVGLAISPDNSLVAAGTFDKRVVVWRVGDGKPRQVADLGGFENYVPVIAFSPDGKILAAAGATGAIRRWSVDGTSLEKYGKPLRGTVGTVFGLIFTPDGKRLAASATDGNLWIWADPLEEEPTLWARLAGLGNEAYANVAGADSDWIAAAGADGRVARWQIDVDEVARQVCAVSGAPVTREEWAQYVPGTPYRKPC